MKLNQNIAIGEVAVDTRKRMFRYSLLCGTSSDAVDAVRSTIAMFWLKHDGPSLSSDVPLDNPL